MLKKTIIFMITTMLCFSMFSNTIASEENQYEVKSSYLKNPNSIIAIADQSAKFWEKAYDTKYGGFYAYLNRDGSIYKNKTYKIAIIQYRNAYAFAKAYQLTGKKEYLDYARKGMDFLYNHAWDKVNGGWYTEMNRDGSLVSKPIDGMDWNNVKWFGNQFGALSGISEMVNVTRNKTDEAWMTKAYSVLEKNMYDSRPGYEGYYEMASKDWSNPNTKSPFSTLDAIASPIMDIYLINLDSKNKNKILTLADVSIKNIIKPMENRQFGYVDRFNSNWKPMQSQSYTNSGNLLKSAVHLYWAYLVNPKPEYKAGAEKLINQILSSKAYDSVNGGPFASLDPQTGNPIDYKKSWWIVETGVTSGLTGFYISKNNDYLKMADESMDFFMNYMYDTKYGDAYEETDADGSKPLTVKGDYWKDAFHPMELFYDTYLYGNLMLNNKPVTLYYCIDPDKKARDIPLNPILLGKNKLVISGVTLDGKTFNSFDGSKCTLKLSANTGGQFKVTFKAVIV